MNSLSPKLIVLIGVIFSGIAGAEPIKLGMTAALSGPSEHIGQALLKGIEPAIKYINDEGGINGQPLELVLYDDSDDPKQSALNAVRLIEEEKVDILFSFVGTPTTLETLPLLSKHKKLLFFPYSGAHFLYEHPNNQFIVNQRASYWQETAAIVDHFITNSKRKIAVYYQHDSFGESGLLGVKKALSAHDTELLLTLNYEAGRKFTDNYADDAEKLLEAGPDAIICIASYEATSGLIKEIRQTSNVPIGTLSFSDPQNIPELIGTDITIFNQLYYSQVTPESSKIDDLENYESITKESFDPVIYEGYKNTIRLAEILKDYSVDELTEKHALIQAELSTASVTLYESQRRDWVLIEE